jgi:pilus assembly protein Flp/PilA
MRGTPVALNPGIAWRNRAVHKEEEMAYLVSLVNSLRREEGQDLLEYALLVALIALVAIAAVTAAGVKVNAVFNAIATAIPS